MTPEKETGFIDPLNLLRFALSIEKDGASAYRSVASHISDGRVENLFLRLAEGEDLHAKKIRAALGKLETEKGLLKNALARLRKPLPLEKYVSILKPIGEELKGFADDRACEDPLKKVIELALRLEQATLEIFSELIRKTEREDLTSLLTWLMNEEERHVELIEKMSY